MCIRHVEKCEIRIILYKKLKYAILKEMIT